MQVQKQNIVSRFNIYCSSKKKFPQHQSFYQVAGGKIFRDFIFETSSVFRADNIFYKKIGLYNTFPQCKLKKRWRNAMFGFFLAIKPVRQKIHQEFIPGMVAPYKKILKKMD